MSKLLKFKSGLKVCYERKRGVRSCAFGIFVGSGSAAEGKDDNGVAHFIEHMLFKGTEKRSAFDIAGEFEKMGANANAYTSRTSTVFYVSGMSKFLPEYFDIMSDMFFNSTFTDENIERERGVVLEEIKMYDDDGESLCADLLNLKHFGKNPFARPILGTEKTVKTLNADKIRAFMAKNYTATNVALSYCGPASEEELRSLVEKHFESEFIKLEASPVVKKKAVKHHVADGTIFNKPFEQANVIIRFPAYGVSDDRSFATDLMTGMLGGGMSSRLFQKVREELGLVYEIYASYSAVRQAGYIDVGFATAPEYVAQAIVAIKEVLAKAGKDGFSPEELEKEKVQKETSAVLGAETTLLQMRVMGRHYLLTGKAYNSAKFLEKTNKVTLDEVSDLYGDIIDTSRASVCYVGKDVGVDFVSLLRKED